MMRVGAFLAPARGRQMSKYDPLSARLEGRPESEWRANFKELERVLGFPLPKAARSGRAWWKDDAGAHARAWSDIGWTAHEVDPAAGKVTFRRSGPLGAAAPPEAPADAKAPVTLGDEPAIVKSLERPKWHMALVAGGLALVAGVGALALRGLMRRRSD
jgi:hypothetical protein